MGGVTLQVYKTNLNAPNYSMWNTNSLNTLHHVGYGLVHGVNKQTKNPVYREISNGKRLDSLSTQCLTLIPH